VLLVFLVEEPSTGDLAFYRSTTRRRFPEPGQPSDPLLKHGLAVCGVQAIAFLVTGSVLAPIVAHIVLHGQLLLRGDELPPAMPQQTVLST
jgi:hypothetical protein